MKIPHNRASVASRLSAFLVMLSFVFSGSTPAQAATISALLAGDRLNYTAPALQPTIETPMGAFVQEVPIQLPSGRNGLQPQLTLTYNSQDYKDSIVGFGWSLSIPSIERVNKTGVGNLYTQNTFSSSLAGELATTTVSNVYRARVDSGDFVQFTFANNSWVAQDKRGVRYIYGLSSGAQIFDPAIPSRTAKWMLEEVRDTNDNYVKYTYQKNVNNQLYPLTIKYTGNGVTDGIYAVNFTTELRPDPMLDYSNAFLIKTTERVNQISVTANGLPVRSYALGYTPGNNGYRSMLSMVTESYTNEDGTTKTLAPWQFSYTNQVPSFEQKAATEWPTIFTSPAYTFFDYNGDALADGIVSARHGGVESAIVSDRLNLGTPGYDRYDNLGNGKLIESSGTWGGETWAAYYNGQYNSSDTGTRFIDINGDTYPDMVRSSVCHNFCGLADYQDLIIKRYYLNQGNGVWGPPIVDSTLPTIVDEYPSISGSSMYRTSAIVGNVNGDAIQDIYPQTTDYPSSNQYGGFLAPNFAQFVDLNNDGLDDIMLSDSDKFKSMINLGGVFSDPDYPILPFQYPTPGVGTDGIDKGIRVMDINNDGLPDIVRSYKFTYWPAQVVFGVVAPIDTGEVNEIWLNTGTQWVKMLNAPQLPLIANPKTVGGLWGGNETITEMFDRDGDGAVDIGNWKTIAPKQDLLKHVVLPTGGTIDATITPTTQQMTGTALNHPKLPMMVWTLTKLEKNDGFGNIETTNYTYKNGRMWFGGKNDRKFAGFNTVTQTTAGKTTTTYYHQGDDTDTARGEYADTFAKISKPYRVEHYDAGGNLYDKTLYKWDTATTTYGNTFVKLAQKIDFSHDGLATHRDKAETYTYDDATGNPLTKSEWGEVVGTEDGSFVDVGSDKRITTTTYATGSTKGVIGAQAQETVTNQPGAKIKESKTSYDNLLFGFVEKGNATKQESWKTGTTYASSTKAYNAYGNVTKETDPRNNTTSYTYDTYNLFPASTQNALGQITSYLYNYGIGKAKQVTDANGRVFQTVYDGRGRVLQELQPDLVTPATLVPKATYTYVDTPLAISTQKTTYLDSTTTNTSYQYADGSGRTIQTRTQAEAPGTYTTKDTVYNNRGVVEKESLPYFSAGTARTSPTIDTALYTTYTYDALDRVTNTANAVGNTANVYGNWKVTTTDPNGNKKDYLRDAYGNLVSVVEYNGTTPYTTTYTYDTFGSLTSLVDALGNVRNFTYDNLGRRLTAQDLHAPADTTFGTWSYTYDDGGNTTSIKDAKGQTINMSYDRINRILTEDYTGLAGTEVAYTYDACADGKTRLCKVIALGAATTTYAYTPLGQTKTETKVIKNTTQTTSYAYDRQGNVTLMTYPNQVHTRYTYSVASQLKKIESDASGVYTEVVSDIDYAPHGQMDHIAYASGANTTKTFDASALYRLQNISTTNGGIGGLLDEEYLMDIATTTTLAVPEFLNSSSSLATQLLPTDVLPIVSEGIVATSTQIVVATSTIPTTPPSRREAKRNAPVSRPSITQVHKKIENKSASERADMKGQEIAKVGRIAKKKRKHDSIEIVSTETIPGGVQVFARAWDENGQQIGFGKDGTVDIERFRIINPPILVEDEGGVILCEHGKKKILLRM